MTKLEVLLVSLILCLCALGVILSSPEPDDKLIPDTQQEAEQVERAIDKLKRRQP